MSGLNITVDDQDPQVIYVGGNWFIQPGCTVCTANPPPDGLQNTVDGTWHDGDFFAKNPDDVFTAQLTFTGTAIYVFGITPSTSTPGVGHQLLDVVFSIDGKPVGEFTKTPSSPEYTYNVPFFSHTGLDPTEHTLLLSLKNATFILLDYFIYTQPPGISASQGATISSTSVSSTTAAQLSHSIDSTAAAAATPTASGSGSSGNRTSPPIGTIVGAVVGSLGGITIIAFLIFLIRYYYHRGYSDGMRWKNGRAMAGPGPNPTDGNGSAPAPAMIGHTGIQGSRNSNRLGPRNPNAVEPFIVPPPFETSSISQTTTSGGTNGRYPAEKSSAVGST